MVVRTLRALAAASAVAILTTLSAGAGTSAAQAPAQFFGVVPQTLLDPANFQQMAAGGVGTVRLRLNWAGIDQSSAPNDNTWWVFDPLVLDAARNGIQVQLFIDGTPTWAAKGLDGRNCPDSRCYLFAPRSKAALKAWRRFAAAAVDRYGPNGSLWAENPGVPKMPVHDWQIWNEENSKTFFAPKPNPKRYARLLGAAWRGIRAHDPSARVVLGGMAELADSRQAVPASGFLADLYRINHARAHFDGVASHPYGATLAKVRPQVKRIRRVMKRAGDAGTPMYVTEIGAGSAEGGNPFDLGLQGQASLLSAIYGYFESKRTAFEIKTVDWFSWQDNSESICLWCPSSGLLTESGAAKPSYDAFTRVSGAAAAKR